MQSEVIDRAEYRERIAQLNDQLRQIMFTKKCRIAFSSSITADGDNQIEILAGEFIP